MTSTTTFGGFNPEKRNSSKVLKPPGGGSSDIFGATGSQEAGTPRRVKNHQQSNLFLNDDVASNTPSRNHDGQMNGGGENGHVEEMQQPQQQAMMNGNGGAMNGNPAPQAPAQPRTRVPPGGFSSGLW